MHEMLKDKVCIVTGAARGIGREIAALFAEEGAQVIVNDAREGSADQWIAESPLKDRLTAMYFDITDETAVKENIMAITKKFGRIDVLVNNAGVEFNELLPSSMPRIIPCVAVGELTVAFTVPQAKNCLKNVKRLVGAQQVMRN